MTRDGLQALVHRTEAWLREEIGAQGRLAVVLDAQERAIRDGNAAALAESAGTLDIELRAGMPREGRRRELARELARVTGAQAETLTLTTIAERAAAAGADTLGLVRLREELRGATASTLRRGRRLAALARYHQGLLNELFLVLAGSPEGGRSEARVTLVDATA
jgi:hypothetical protein